ncbi:Radical SAM domain protein [hydrothermal vent metagenome]|uniref:Radical SAM domain protein n=1 Tax=hydrothermal vent metagenome TaxID=652676 RepID=A0A3B1BZ71_9ZZZZ
MSLVFGPVPSRRLGRSLGINNIPPKECTYACVYCQLGNTIKLEVERKRFYSTEDLVAAVEKQLKNLNYKSNKIDYLTFVPDGEPTLDINLAENIKALKKFGIKIAIITNSSLLGNKEVRDALLLADWVSVKVDTVNEETWHKIDRPHGKLNFNEILEGIKIFSKEYSDYFVTETMLVKGFNDSTDELKATSKYVSGLNPDTAYIAIPTRPPAEEFVIPPDEEEINNAYQIFSSDGIKVELIIGYEGNEFSATGNLAENVLNITAVHPMRKDAIDELILKDNGAWQDIDYLVDSGKLIKSEFEGKVFYIRNLKEWRKSRDQ